MNWDFQTIAVALLVLGAAYYLYVRFRPKPSSQGCGSNCGCERSSHFSSAKAK